MKKAAIIGGGYIGLVHANAYKNSAKVELAAVVDVNEEAGRKLAEEYDCVFYTDAQEMIDKEKPDFVDICVPTFLHEQFVVLAAKNKVNVLCEKPVALSVEAVDRMVAAAKEAGIVFMVAQVIRFWPEYVQIKKMYDRGDFGNIKMVYANRLAQFPAWMNWNQDPNKSAKARLRHSIIAKVYLAYPLAEYLNPVLRIPHIHDIPNVKIRTHIIASHFVNQVAHL